MIKIQSRVLVDVKCLKKYFPLKRHIFTRSQGDYVRAVDNISISIERKATLALVGESGSGKTTVGRLILGLLKPTEGTIRFDGLDVLNISRRERRRLGKQMQMIFQNAYESLNPRKTVEDILSLPFRVHTNLSNEEISNEVCSLLSILDLTPIETFASKYAHELSGGQRQRVAIGRAIALKPLFVIADEPVASLDVSVRGKILNMMKSLKDTFGISYLYISHNLAVCRSIADVIAVMYLGKIAELCSVDEFYKGPLHPYAQLLLSAVPVPDPTEARAGARVHGAIEDNVPSTVGLPSGCRFQTRCNYRKSQCGEEPDLVEVRKNHFVACHLF